MVNDLHCKYFSVSLECYSSQANKGRRGPTVNSFGENDLNQHYKHQRNYSDLVKQTQIGALIHCLTQPVLVGRVLGLHSPGEQRHSTVSWDASSTQRSQDVTLKKCMSTTASENQNDNRLIGRLSFTTVHYRLLMLSWVGRIH